MAEPLLHLRGISHRYGSVEHGVSVLKDVSLSLEAGSMAALVGPSGSGKTTLLQIAGLLDSPTGGEIHIAGQAAHKASESVRTRLRREKIGFVFQFHHLLPEFSALENVLMPLEIAGKVNRIAIQRAQDLIERVGLKDRAHHRPGELSGGERQRIAMVRALIHKPALLLADEPTGNLDEASAQIVFDLLLALAKSESTAMLIATHNLTLMRQLPRAYQLTHGTLKPITP